MHQNQRKMDDNFCESFDYQKHWNAAYLKIPLKSLGWYQEIPQPSIDLINECNLPDDALIFNAGAGASTLINHLQKQGYTNFIVNDISFAALTELKENLNNYKHCSIQFILDDLINPSEALLKLKNIDVWHDRAVLHFFTNEEDQKKYFNLIKKVLKVGGFIIFAQFNKEGAKKCNGLDVVNYNEEMFKERLGDDFELLNSFNYTYMQPSGNTREFVYALFKRNQ